MILAPHITTDRDTIGRMSRNDFTTIIFACPGRHAQHRLLQESIADSDLSEYEVSMHPEGLTPWQHWEATHRRAAAVKTPFVLVLEDDVILNRHVRHNITTWKSKHDPIFGAGWLFNCGGWGAQREAWYNGNWEWYGTVAVLYDTEKLKQILDCTMKRYEETKTAWDHCISWAVHASGYRIRVSVPPMVEHLDHLPSAMGNLTYAGNKFRSTWGTFKLDWKRPPGDPNGLRPHELTA